MSNFSKWLYETKGMTDISILSADTVLTTEQKKSVFLLEPCVVESRPSGDKLTVLKIADNGNINDYIFAYENDILYAEEFGYLSDAAIKANSIGASRFKLAIKHFAKLGKNDIPIGTELYINFMMPEHNKRCSMILIQYAKSEYTAKFGKLYTVSTDVSIENRDAYAKMLKISTPRILFDGVLGSPISFKKGIKDAALKQAFNSVKNTLTWDNPSHLYTQIKQLFLSDSIGSVLIKTASDIFKWQQDTYVSRVALKQRYREDTEELETQYWENVRNAARTLADSVDIGTENDMLTSLAKRLKTFKVKFEHSKKSVVAIKDDIQVNAKTLLIKRMKGNNGCLILGKFRVLTKGHVKLIKKAISDYDNVCLCLVTPKELSDTRQLRLEMLQKTFSDKLTIIEHPTGTISRVLPRTPFNVNVIYAGSDRLTSYQNQTKDLIGITVREYYRADADISATNVIEQIQDETFFKANTPKEIHDLYPEIEKIYKKS